MLNRINLHKYRYLPIFVAILVAIAAGLGAGPALAQSDADGHNGKAGAASEDGEESAAGPYYYKLDVLLAPVVAKRRVKGYAEVVVTLEMADQEGESAVRDKILILRDEFLRDLQFQAGMRGEGDPAISLKRIKARFKALAARVVGDGVVTEVLIDSAIYHGT